MLWRISYFLLWQIAGGGLGWWEGGPWGAALGAALAGWAWFVWDLLRGVRVLPGAYLSREVAGQNPGKGYIRVALVAPKDEMQRGLIRLRDCLYG